MSAAMDNFIHFSGASKMKISDKEMTSPLVGLKPRICCQKHVKNSSATAKLDLNSSSSAVERCSSFSWRVPSLYSFIHSPQRRQQSLLSCYSHELLKPPAMNYSAAQNGGRMSVWLPLWSFKKPFYLLLHIWWPRYNEFNEGDFARRQVLDFRLVWISKARLSETD